MADERILIVDDEAGVRQSIAATLETSGYMVAEAESVSEAIRLLETHADWSLVLTDLVMPGTNGISLLEHVRRRFPRVPLLWLLEFTIFPWLWKPFDGALTT